MHFLRRPLVAALALVLAAAGTTLAVHRVRAGGEAQAACPPGFTTPAQRERLREREQRFERAAAAGERQPTGEGEGEAERRAEGGQGCQPRKHPESVADLAAVNAFRSVRASAPFDTVAPGAFAAAARQRDGRAAEPRTLAGTGGTWQPAGNGPLVADDERFAEVNGLGMGDLAGRITDFAYDTGHDRVLASVGEGGVWASDDRGAHWRSIGEGLPTQAVGSVAFVPAKGSRPDTILALTGDAVFGGGTTYAGVGVWRSTDGGATWDHSTGVPDSLLGFRLKVDPTDPDVVYAATGRGLFRSSDGGATFSNVELPTGDCAGDTTNPHCFLANMVTDVAIQAPGGTTGAKGGAVVAGVGWRAGNKQNARGFVESPSNGVYVSDTGAKGTFTKVDTTNSGFAAGTPNSSGNQGAIGRIELGAATGPKQDHGFLYAIVQDASGFKKGEVSGIDVPDQSPQATPTNTYLRGIYVSKDFGRTWKLMANATSLQGPATGSALSLTACATLYCPGIQSWYNEWVEPDPTQADTNGVPTRLTFGLEEVWQNDDAAGGRRPQDGPSPFKVIGRYFGGTTCQFLNTGLPRCPTNRGDDNSYTTHPDQHSAIYLPAPEGGSQLLVGNDGGAFTQSANRGEEFSNTKWHRGANQGFTTLLPYDAQVAKDGTVYAGLQDNGELRIDPGTRKQVQVYGGDGGYSAVDPDNSDIAYEEYVLGDMRVTKDGGRTWKDILPPTDTYQFINPFVMDPSDASHLLTAGTKVYETTKGPETTTADWNTVFDLGMSPDGKPNQMSAIDTRSYPTGGGQGLPTGPRTPDAAWTGGGSTVPGAGSGLPGTYDDHPFTIGAGDGDASATMEVTWADSSNDWDLEVLRKDSSGNLVSVGTSAQGSTTGEKVVLANPQHGDYVVRTTNFAASGAYDGTVKFTQRTADAPKTQSVSYAGYCGSCDVLNGERFDNGIATSAGGTWHAARAAGLPRRYITSVQADPADPRTVYVTLGGYSRRWLPVGAVGESTRDVGAGHVFKSTDGGDTFTDVSGDLPDAPANFSMVRAGQLVVATDVGVYVAAGVDGGSYQLLGQGLPAAPVYSLELKPKASPGEPDTLVVATQGRGVWSYVFEDPSATGGGTTPGASGSTPGGTTTTPLTAGSGSRGTGATATVRATGTTTAASATKRGRSAIRLTRRLVASFRVTGKGRTLRVLIRLRRAGTVRVVTVRGGRVVQRTAARRLAAGMPAALVLRLPARGAYQVTLSARAGRMADTRTLRRKV